MYLVLLLVTQIQRLRVKIFFPSTEDTALRYRYETRYRTATIMEEDALDQPTAAGELLSACQIEPSALLLTWCGTTGHNFSPRSSVIEADLSLHTLSESPCGSLVVYVIPESSSLLPQVKTTLVCIYSYHHHII